MSYFIVGECTVWTSPAILQLLSNDKDINPLGSPISSYDMSLIAGLFAIGSAIAPLLCGKLIDVIGRRNMLIFAALLNSISLMILAFTPNIILIFIARMLNGISLGCSQPILTTFLSEITAHDNRGKFGCFSMLFLPLGQLYGFIMGNFFSIKFFTISYVLPVLLHMVLLMFLPQTPVQLLRKGKIDAAYKSLTKYRGKLCPQEIEKEFDLMKSFFDKKSRSNNKRALISLISDQPTRRGLFIGIALLTIQLGSGAGIIISFLGPIFQDAKTGVSGNMTAIVVGSLKMLTFFFVSQIVKSIGRKRLMLVSSISTSISLFLLGVYFYMKEMNYPSYQSYSWLPITSVLFFILTYAVGLGALPVVTVGELFDDNIRATAVSTVIFITRMFGTVFFVIYPIMLEFIGNSGWMWFFSASCALGAVFVQFVLPETEGKSIHEIQEILQRKLY